MATETSVPVALLFQTDELGRHLRTVLNDIGTPIVYESTTHAIDRVSLEQSGARVVIVNLDSELDGDLDQVYDLLGDGPYRVLINEGHVSSRLSGWDQARWMRHLAAKILDTPAVTDPPRPADAEPVPAPPAPSGATPADEPVVAIDGSAVSQPATAEAAIGRLEDAVPAPSEALEGLEAADLRVADIDEDEPFSFDDLDVAPPLVPPEAGEATQTRAYETLEAVSLDIEPFDVDALDDAPYASTDAAPLDPGPLDLDRLDAPLVSDAPQFDPVAAPRLTASAAADADAQVDAVAFSDEEAQLFAAFDTAGDGEPARRDDAPVADLDDWLSRAMADDPAAAIERPHWEDEPAQTEAPVARLDTQPVFSDSFQPAGDDPKPAVPAVPDWSLVSFDLDDEEAPQAPPPAPFGVEKISAAEYMAAASPYAGEVAEETIETDGLSLELVPIEDAIAPQPAHATHEVWLDADAAAAAVSDAKAAAAVDRVVVLCASIGGPEAIREVIGAIPKRYPALFVLVQHMGEEFIDLLAQQLARATALTVRVPSHGERVAAGDLLIAPPNRELRIQRDGTVLIQPQNPPAPHQPSIDRILESLAATFGADVLAIVFSGMSDDGAAGCRHVAEAGGQVWVQDPASCVVSEMVENALATGVVRFQGSPTSLAEHLASLRDGAEARA